MPLTPEPLIDDSPHPQGTAYLDPTLLKLTMPPPQLTPTQLAQLTPNAVDGTYATNPFGYPSSQGNMWASPVGVGASLGPTPTAYDTTPFTPAWRFASHTPAPSLAAAGLEHLHGSMPAPQAPAPLSLASMFNSGGQWVSPEGLVYRDDPSTAATSTYTMPTGIPIATTPFTSVPPGASISLPPVPPNTGGTAGATSLTPWLSTFTTHEVPTPSSLGPIRPGPPHKRHSSQLSPMPPPPMIRRTSTPLTKRRFHPAAPASISLPVEYELMHGSLEEEGLTGKKSPEKKERFRPSKEQLEILITAYDENQ